MQHFMRTFFICMLAVLCYSESVAKAASIAKVISVTEGTTIERNGKSQALALKDDVFINDVISTTATGKAQLIFNDDTIVSIGVNSKFYMSDYSDSERKAFKANVAEGFARFVTGAIVKANPDAFTVRTPEATAGIRGTIISILLEGGQTIFMVEGSGLEGAPSVVVNGVTIAPGQMAAFGPNGVLISPPALITPQHRQIIDTQTSISLNQNAQQEFIAALGAAGVDLDVDDDANMNVHELSEGLNQDLLLENLVGMDLDVEVDGTFTFSPFDKGTFSFEANLRNGSIFNANVVPDTQGFNVTGGTGTISADSFYISGGVAKDFTTPVNSWYMQGNQTINTSTTNVDGKIEYILGSDFSDGTFEGTVNRD